jgi:PAS domain S-box-containing protein
LTDGAESEDHGGAPDVHDDSEASALLLAIRLSPIASVISNPRLPDNPIVAVNAAFCELTGYPEAEILGRNCRFLAGARTEPWLTETIRQATRRRTPVLVEILNYKRDGTPFRNAVLVAPVFGADGELTYFLGSQVEVSDDSPAPATARRGHAVEQIKDLSPRQLQILREVAAGYRTKQIAWRLSLSEKTVKMHRAILFERLGTTNVAEAVRIAVEAGL